MKGVRDSQGFVCVRYNPVSGSGTWIKFDGDDAIIETRQNIDDLLNENKALYNMASSNWKGDGLHSVARIPTSMAHDPNSLIGGALKAMDTKALFKALNDSDNQALRTKGGTL